MAFELTPPTSSGQADLRVCIIEDQRDLREGFADLISAAPGFLCAGAYASMEEALAGMARDTLPDVALVDLELPGISGIEGIRLFRDRWPSLSVLILTVHGDPHRVFGGLCAGANGYLLKSASPDRLLSAIQESARGGLPLSPEVARYVVDLFKRLPPDSTAAFHLTPHELRILKMLVNGENYKSCAGLLGVTVNTISYHVRHIYEKLHVHSRSEAVAKALRSGLLG